MAAKFSSLNLLFLLAFFTLSVFVCLGDEGKLLVPKKPEQSSNWEQWTKVAYMIFDQCHPHPDMGLDYGIGSYRLHFYCSTKGCRDADEAKLYVCYPSMLDPESVEMAEEGTFPYRRAPHHLWARNDRQHEISTICAELLGICANNAECEKSIENRKIHGFLVHRKKGEFVIEMPFGKNGIGINFTVRDDDDKPGRFYINFGDAENAITTYVMRGHRSDREMKRYKKMKDEGNSNAYDYYFKNRNQGMPLSKGQHLWMLGLDILETEENQALHFLTKGIPKNITKKICNRIEGNDENILEIKSQTIRRFINAMFLTPLQSDPAEQTLPNINETGFTFQEKPSADRLINLATKDNHSYIEKFSSFLQGIEFVLSAWVPKNAANFSILIYHGFYNYLDQLGQKVLQIDVAFDGAKLSECNVINFLQNVTVECEISTNEGAAIEQNQLFWLWLRIHDGKMQISLNCNEMEFTIGNIPYAEESFIKYSGDLELVLFGQRDKRDVATEMLSETNPEWDGKFPVLANRKIDLSDVKKLLMLSAKFALDKDGAKRKIEISLVNTTNPSNSFNISFEEKCTPNFIKKANCTQSDICLVVRGFGYCLPPSASFNLVLMCVDEPKNPLPMPVGQENQKTLDMYFYGSKVSKSQGDNCQANFTKIEGDLEYPLLLNQMAFVNNYPSATYKHTIVPNDSINFIKNDRYVNIHLMWLGSIDANEKDGNKITILFDCGGQRCYLNQKIEQTTLKLEITFGKLKTEINAKSYQPDVEKEREKIKTVGEKNGETGRENPFWLKIYVNENLYKIYQNGTHIMDIDAGKLLRILNLYANGFEFRGNLALLNNPMVFPYQYKFPLNKKLAADSTLTIKWRILKNAELIEFFIAKGNAKLLGTPNQNKFEDGKSGNPSQSDVPTEEKSDKLFMHIRAHKDLETGKVCIHSAFIKTDADCQTQLRNKANNVVQLLNAAYFKEDNVHELKITFVANFAVVQLDYNEPIKFPAHKLLDAEDFVINGDMTIIEAPQLIDPATS